MLRSEKGDAIILLSILITGIVMLICVIAVESLRNSADIQNVQKKSLNNLYQAEEGIEYSLYTNKQKNQNQDFSVDSKHFAISLFENDNKELGEKAVQKLIEPIEGRGAVIVSESNESEDVLKRAVFANIPHRYYDQVPLWNIRDDCEEEGINCSFETESANEEQIYQTAFYNGNFKNDDEEWSVENTKYRLIFVCASDNCTMSGIRVGANCNFTECGVEGFVDVPDYNCLLNPISLEGEPGKEFPDGERSGKVIVSDWVSYEQKDGTPFDLRGKKIVVQFTLNEGALEKVNGLSSENGEIRMCKKKNNGTWEPLLDKRLGLASLEIKQFPSP